MTQRYTFRLAKQSLALSLSFSMIWTSGLAEAALEAPQAAREAQFEFAPPSSLGFVVDSFAGKTDSKTPPQVILIQDLHAHYGAQKNIAGILEFLTKKLQATS